jgi:hypothetical protein
VDLFTSFIVTGLGSGFALGITKFGYDLLRDRRERKGKQQHLALRLAFYFENFAVGCANRVIAHELHEDHGGQVGRRIGEIPSPGELPVSTAYELIGAELLNEIFDFPQRCQMANDNAYFWWDVVGDDEACSNALKGGTVEVGNLALQISRRVRSAHELSPRKLEFEKWDVEKFFAEQMASINGARRVRDAAD